MPALLARRRRRRWLRGAIADTRAELEAIARQGDPRLEGLARAARTTLIALEDELTALRGGGGPPLGTPPSRGWSPRERWLQAASERTAGALGTSDAALGTLRALERERELREGAG